MDNKNDSSITQQQAQSTPQATQQQKNKFHILSLPEVWKNKIIMILPWYAVFQFVYLFILQNLTAIHVPKIIYNILSIQHYIPFSNIINIAKLLPETLLGLLMTFSMDHFPQSANVFFNMPFATFTSIFPILCQILFLILLFKRTRVAWFLMVVITLYDLRLSIIIFDFSDVIQLVVILLSFYLLWEIRGYYWQKEVLR